MPTDIVKPADPDPMFRYADVLDIHRLEKLVVENGIDTIVHFSALLSAIGEQQVGRALNVNNRGTENVLELARQHKLSVFCPSTIGAFGPTTPLDNTPDYTIQRPNTVYGVTKVYMELLGSYYHHKYDVDFRSLRLPGIISSDSEPGGGTTDYAVEIFFHAIQHPDVPFECYLRPDSSLPMMMISDCVRAITEFMGTDSSNLSQRVYNLSVPIAPVAPHFSLSSSYCCPQACAFTPEQVAAAIQKRIPGFTIE